MKFLPPDLRHRPLSIVYHDSDIVVVDKMHDFLSVPGRGPELADCVVARVRELYPQAHGSLAAHRLDMETSGLMVLGLTPHAHRHLSRQFEQRLVRKRYVALLEGSVAEDAGRIELPFRLDPDNRPRQILDIDHGKMGITDWRVMERGSQTTRVAFVPHTGRTHQLRVHAAHTQGLGHPIVGDRLYGTAAERLMLHATALAFHHPKDERWISFELPVPF